MPPAPIAATISYGPSFVPGKSGMASESAYRNRAVCDRTLHQRGPLSVIEQSLRQVILRFEAAT
jgi:hypothetical protein